MTKSQARQARQERQARQRAPTSLTAISQVAKGMSARYDAAGNGKRIAGWNPPSSGPNRAIVGLQKIRDRARDAVRNDWSGESAIQKWATSLVGIGIVPRLRRIKDRKRKQELNDLWDSFCAVCDADGILNFYGLQTLGVRAWLEAGEVFIRQRPRFPNDGLPVPLQVQLVESDFVPLLDATSYTGLPVGNVIKSGIEFDNRGQRIAYWMYREHPGDPQGGTIIASKLVRIAASQVKHVFMPMRPGQLRGVSSLAPTLTKLRDIGNYTDAVLLRQQIANLFVAFITRTLGDGEENDPLTGKSIEGSLDKPLAGLSPGIMQELDDGQTVTFGNPPEAGTTYSDYLRTENMTVAAASGLPYELHSGDIKEVSDRTLRVIINEFRRLAEQRQWQVVIPMICQPVREWFVDAALRAGLVSLAELSDVKRVEWAPHGWAYIHPVQDPQGKKIEVDAGFRSRSSVVGERGDDPETVDAERQADDEREQTLEIGPYSEAAQMAAAGAAPAQSDAAPEGDGIAPGEYSAPPNPSALETALERRATAEADLLEARREVLKNPPAATPAAPNALEQAQLELLTRTTALLEIGDESAQ